MKEEFKSLRYLWTPGEEKDGGGVSHRPVLRGARFIQIRERGRRLVAVAPQSQFKVSAKQLLIKRREVRTHHVRVHGPERTQLLRVTGAQGTQR